jgi:hypothetical protein
LIWEGGSVIVDWLFVDEPVVDVFPQAFRDLKTDLGFRPVHHQLVERTEAHLFISVLAYHLLNLIECELRDSGDHRRWYTIKDVLSTHRRTTVIMTDDEDQIHHIRCSGVPETEHKEIIVC